MDGVQLPQVYRATTRRYFTFYHQVTTIDLKCPKKVAANYFWLRRKKCVIYRLDIILSITHVVQLMV